MSKICEVRMPTYKRPKKLSRALQSLCRQTYPHWKALVFDDSPEQEAKNVVEDFGDPRIWYEPNPQNLGAAKNIDRCFQPITSDAGYAFMLEDDNWIYPEFIERNVDLVERHKVNLVLRNQEIWYEQHGESEDTGRTMRGNAFEEGIIPARNFQMMPLLFEGISNGGLFWTRHLLSDLQVGETVPYAGLQERCRSFQIEEPVYFGAHPLAVWTHLEGDEILRSSVKGRRRARAKQAMVKIVLRHFGSQAIELNANYARALNSEKELEHVLVESGHLRYRSGFFSPSERVMIAAKGLAKRLAISDPLKDYWKTKKAVFLRPSW
ncbi:MAG: glycosyltransferase family 2 protein [Bacteroidota bacterium]